ncbi:unnamed protein product [Leptidea sinapis]|uniref:Uncharacterized protein n=1 Tax=Leptidea sinapis TaxID=189913 RepID=A0A5E4Q6E2_9NEOP|nr:unnamed protein product [Leptidea sinapis]
MLHINSQNVRHKGLDRDPALDAGLAPGRATPGHDTTASGLVHAPDTDQGDHIAVPTPEHQTFTIAITSSQFTLEA